MNLSGRKTLPYEFFRKKNLSVNLEFNLSLSTNQLSPAPGRFSSVTFPFFMDRVNSDTQLSGFGYVSAKTTYCSLNLLNWLGVMPFAFCSLASIFEKSEGWKVQSGFSKSFGVGISKEVGKNMVEVFLDLENLKLGMHLVNG